MTRYCDKHSGEKMTLLFNSYVCDVCSPPSSATQLGTTQQQVKHLRNDADKYVLCPTCGDRARFADHNSLNGRDTNNWYGHCINKHAWIPVGGWKVGDKTFNRISSGNDYEWIGGNACQWKLIK